MVAPGRGAVSYERGTPVYDPLSALLLESSVLRPNPGRDRLKDQIFDANLVFESLLVTRLPQDTTEALEKSRRYM